MPQRVATENNSQPEIISLASGNTIMWFENNVQFSCLILQNPKNRVFGTK
jgi:hypothetical protein